MKQDYTPALPRFIVVRTPTGNSSTTLMACFYTKDDAEHYAKRQAQINPGWKYASAELTMTVVSNNLTIERF